MNKRYNKRYIIGEYNKLGYTIIDTHNLSEVYSAGNNPNDSVGNTPNESPQFCAVPLSLKKIRSMCISTGKEIAKEKGYKWGGCSRLEEE